MILRVTLISLYAVTDKPEAPDSRLNWNLEMLGFEGTGRPEYPENNLLVQGREPITNSTHVQQEFENQNQATLVGGECSHHCAIPAPHYYALLYTELFI